MATATKIQLKEFNKGEALNGASLKYNVRAIPTLLVLDENDNLVRKMTGLPATPTDLTKFVYE